MKTTALFPAWGRILRGQKPFLSLEITKECPLTCPGCYAYNPNHLGEIGSLRELRDAKGDDLVSGVLSVVRRYRPLHVSVVGGEPLVRYRELEILLPKLLQMGIEVMVVTSAVRPIPEAWKDLSGLNIAVSIDGLQPEHDKRRAPATYERILKHIAPHRVTIHCTITRQQIQRDGYLEEFARFWSARSGVKKIWFSLYTPQEGEISEERLDRSGPRQSPRGTSDLAPQISPDRPPGSSAEWLPFAACVAGRVHLLANHQLRVVRLHNPHFTLSVWRESGVYRMRLLCLSRACGVRKIQVGRARFGWLALHRLPEARDPFGWSGSLGPQFSDELGIEHGLILRAVGENLKLMSQAGSLDREQAKFYPEYRAA